jgi:hypothetical protein
MPSVFDKLNGRRLPSELRAVLSKVMNEPVSVHDNGDIISGWEKLCRHIRQLALGGEREERDDNGNIKKIVEKPVAWAVQFVFAELAGKTPQAVQEDHGGIKASQKVRELARDRMNQVADKLVTAGGPPKFKPKGG